jgi:hypothetical protein
MIARTELAALAPAKRAQVIYAEAQSALSNRLWRAALGDVDGRDRDGAGFRGTDMRMESLLGLLGGQDKVAGPGAGCGCGCACACHGGTPRAELGQRASAALRGPVQDAIHEPTAMVSAPASGVAGAGVALGVNARHAPALAAAEARTGIPAPALAAIVDAEAAKGHDGSWNPLSRNPRSSAAGLGQFLSGTWQDLARTPGTWLNGEATRRGWIDARGCIEPGHRAELLALRYDPQASILSVADLAKLNLDRLEKGGVRVRTDAETLAKAAYLSHHLGLGDARKFLAGGIEPGRARMLLSAQIGASAAERRIADSGNATQAHRTWLLGFIDRRIQPDRFAA